MSRGSYYSSQSLRWRLIGALTAFSTIIFVFLVIGFHTADGSNGTTRRNSTFLPVTHRKLLNHAIGNDDGKGKLNTTEVEEPNRIWSEKCSKSDIMISQGATEPLPNGIPTYTVEIMNVGVSGCDISGIHLSCGWFSSARLVNPRVFKRIRFDDCLVNEGKPLANGRTLSFQYANTFRYPLTVFSVSC